MIIQTCIILTKGGEDMALIRSAAEIAEKYTRVTPTRTPDYEAGVKAPLKDWEAGAKAAEPAYKEGVMKAATEGRYGKGVAKVKTAKWQRKAVEVGTARYGPGVSAAGPDYQVGFEPYQRVIAGTTLPPRYPKGDPRNIERVRTIATALRAAKTK